MRRNTRKKQVPGPSGRSISFRMGDVFHDVSHLSLVNKHLWKLNENYRHGYNNLLKRWPILNEFSRLCFLRLTCPYFPWSQVLHYFQGTWTTIATCFELDGVQSFGFFCRMWASNLMGPTTEIMCDWMWNFLHPENWLWTRHKCDLDFSVALGTGPWSCAPENILNCITSFFVMMMYHDNTRKNGKVYIRLSTKV